MGMAGSGKTTLLQRLNLYTTEMGIKSYFINLDPAVKQVPFGASIDIRDTVNYKEVCVCMCVYACASIFNVHGPDHGTAVPLCKQNSLTKKCFYSTTGLLHKYFGFILVHGTRFCENFKT